MSPKVRDTIERLFWTFVAAFGGGLVAPALIPSIDVSAIQAAALAGVAAVVNAVTLIARDRLAVLPAPGQALTQEAATEAYRQIEAND
jgi:hypothetical protein